MDAILSLLVLSALAFLAYGPWQDACTDFARQRIFANRDHLFDLARTGRLDFNSYHYREIRISLEQNIRFAHMLTLPKLFVYKLSLGRKFESTSETKRIIDRIENEQLRNEVSALIKDSQISLAFMMIMKSPLFMFMMPLFVTIYLNHRVAKFIYGVAALRLDRIGELIQIEAERAPTAKFTAL